MIVVRLVEIQHNDLLLVWRYSIFKIGREKIFLIKKSTVRRKERKILLFILFFWGGEKSARQSEALIFSLGFVWESLNCFIIFMQIRGKFYVNCTCGGWFGFQKHDNNDDGTSRITEPSGMRGAAVVLCIFTITYECVCVVTACAFYSCGINNTRISPKNGSWNPTRLREAGFYSWQLLYYYHYYFFFSLFVSVTKR